MSKPSEAPFTNEEFNEVYSSAFNHWLWSDVRIPKELKELVKTANPKTSLELGTGLGRFSVFMAEQGIKATGVDFSSVAIEKAKRQAADKEHQPEFICGDVTNLKNINEQFDVSFDVGCFHCLDAEGQKKYASEIYRLLKPGAPHLIWALDSSPSGAKLDHNLIAKIFEPEFQLVKAAFSRRRIIASHWYWLLRAK